MVFILILGFLFLSSLYLLRDLPGHDHKTDELTKKIDSLLPQTQCGACNYSGCLPYARAIVEGKANINQCSPGGDATIHAIADMLGREALELNPEHDLIKNGQVALIDEDVCIGCVKCIKACPVDAIIGAPKQLHTVIAGACTGCELCIPPCPVDCISMVSSRDSKERWLWQKPGKAATVGR